MASRIHRGTRHVGMAASLAMALSACSMFEIMAPQQQAPPPIENVEVGPVEGLSIAWPDGVDERLNFLVTSLHVRAQDPEELADLGDLSLHPDGVELRLGNSGHVREVAVDALHDPATWEFEVPEGYAGFVGPFSVLRSLEGVDELTVSVGEHDFCANPPQPTPDHLTGFTLVGITPAAIDSCIDWFAVDLWLDEDGLVRAIRLELYGP